MNRDTVWFFDLDNTLHHADAGIFGIINRAMTDFLAGRLNLSGEAASRLRQDYWHRYGATAVGLRIHHPEISVAEFLSAAHPPQQIRAALVPAKGAAETLGRLKGRKTVFTNAPSAYAHMLIEAMGLDGFFECTVAAEDTAYRCKPDPEAYLCACRAANTLPGPHCIMVDDSAANLYAAKKLGMTTVWYGQSAHGLPFADFAASDMAALADWAQSQDLCFSGGRQQPAAAV